jgi:hypothetical protein
MIVPMIIIGTCRLIAAVPRIAVAGAAKILENSADYSISEYCSTCSVPASQPRAEVSHQDGSRYFLLQVWCLGQAGIVWLGTRLVFTVRGLHYATHSWGSSGSASPLLLHGVQTHIEFTCGRTLHETLLIFAVE